MLLKRPYEARRMQRNQHMTNPMSEDNPHAYPQPLVSVVMPVFNQERVLRLTLESVLSQTFRNFELVLVDDGSVDGSLEIEREFGNRDHRIRLFPQVHKGAAPARNFGLDASVGRYVIFLDSDDLFHPDLLLDMASVLEATGADICICESDTFCGNKRSVNSLQRLNHYKEGLYHRHAFGRATFQVGGSTAWNKMYRREFLIDSGALFYDTKCCNDCFFVYKTMWEANSVYLLKKTLVHYRRGLGTSISDGRREHPYETIRVAEKSFAGIFEPGEFSESEAASLRIACSNLLMMGVGDLIATNSYSEELHDDVLAILRYWGSPGIPRNYSELKPALKRALVKYAAYDEIVWAHAHWVKKASDHTLREKIDFASRIVIALAFSHMPIAR